MKTCATATAKERVVAIHIILGAFCAFLAVHVAEAGDLQIDLADIVGFGDGTGTGGHTGIDPQTGTLVTEHSYHHFVSNANQFVPTSNPFIDGVFVPDGGPSGTGLVPVSSTGLVITGLSEGEHDTWDAIWNGRNVSVGRVFAVSTIIGMHANKGITFDLDAIRAANSGFKAASFSAKAMMEGDDTFYSDVDFYVAIDGVIAAHTRLAMQAFENLTIPLKETDRFLTLMTLSNGTINADHSSFGNPYVLLTDDAPLAGDANGDGMVDLADFGLLKANFGNGSTEGEGDFNGDGAVDLADFGILKENFGKSDAATVPEPPTFLLAALAGIGLLAVRAKSLRRSRPSG